MINLIILFWVVILLILLSEMAGYFWHNLVHNDKAPGVYETHKIHHQADLTHEAHEDFYWVIVLLILLGIFVFVVRNYISLYYLIPAYLIIVVVFVWNWYVHSAYHISNHWLNKYKWFQTDKKIHLQHHVNPWKNYGIASHFSDVIFGTYEYPTEDPTEVFDRTMNKKMNYNKKS